MPTSATLYPTLSESPRAVTDVGVLVPLFLLNVLAGPLGEELGWRGTALPRLLARWGALTASLVLGIVWWTFHTPGFLLGLFPSGFTPATALLGALALTVLITWMFNNTGGSSIPGSLMHLSINFVTATSGVAESPMLYGMTVGFLIATAVIVVLILAGVAWCISPHWGAGQPLTADAVNSPHG
jgi:membrane protease YdiL (CAAX protease family)